MFIFLGTTSQLSFDPTSGAIFLEQRLPELYEKLWNSVQGLKQNVNMMLEEVLPKYEQQQKLTQIYATKLDELTSLTGIIKRE